MAGKTLKIDQNPDNTWPATAVPNDVTKIKFKPTNKNKMKKGANFPSCNGSQFGTQTLTGDDLDVDYDKPPTGQPCTVDATLHWDAETLAADQQTASDGPATLAAGADGESGIAQLTLQPG